jgi:hypothetical protein
MGSRGRSKRADLIVNPVTGKFIKPAAKPREDDIEKMKYVLTRTILNVDRLTPREIRKAARRAAAIVGGGHSAVAVPRIQDGGIAMLYLSLEPSFTRSKSNIRARGEQAI